jgi:hypothetical protein
MPAVYDLMPAVCSLMPAVYALMPTADGKQDREFFLPQRRVGLHSPRSTASFHA